MLVLFGFYLFAQQPLPTQEEEAYEMIPLLEWYQDYSMEAFFSSWDVEVDVWVIKWEDNTLTINLEDVWSEDWYDVRAQFQTALYALYDEIDYRGLTLEDLGIAMFIYSWFEGDYQSLNADIRYENDDLRWDIYLDYIWLEEYFTARRDRDRSNMAGEAVDALVAQWEATNRSFLSRDLDEFQNFIKEQTELQETFDEDREEFDGSIKNPPNGK